MEKIRLYVYIPVALICIYITVMAITNNSEEFHFGYISFSTDILNNYSSLLGAIVGLLGVILLVETLWLQYNQFKSSEKEKNRDEKLDWYYKLSLLQVDLEVILKDIDTKSSKIKEYYESVLKAPFETHMLMRTPSRNYSRILELDRLSIYKAFKHFLAANELWLSYFNRLYSTLDFLPEYFKDIYDKYDYHSKDIFNTKMLVRDSLINFMDQGSALINEYKAEYDNASYLAKPASNLTNETIKRYYEVLDESYDADGNISKETDFSKIDDHVLRFFIEEALKQRNTSPTFDRRLEPLIEVAANIKKQINLTKERSIEFAKNIESQYKNLNIDNAEEKSIVTVVTEIKDIVKNKLDALDPSKL